MKWDFFYDESDNRPYQSIHDWYIEVKHLLWTAVIILSLAIAILLSINLTS